MVYQGGKWSDADRVPAVCRSTLNDQKERLLVQSRESLMRTRGQGVVHSNSITDHTCSGPRGTFDDPANQVWWSSE